jgi:sugar phosphate isomerase/epimerase
MYRFSCADYTFPVLDRHDALRLVKLLGFDYVDIGLFARNSHFSPIDLLASPREYTANILHDLDAAELRVADVFVQIGVDPSECAVNDPNPAVRIENRDTFAYALEFCVALGCKHLTGLPGVFQSKCSLESDFALAAEETAWRVTQCARAGVCYSIEPHVDSICAQTGSARAFLEAVKGLTLTLDYGHFVAAGETSQHVHDLLSFASHIHVRGGAAGRLQTSVKENVIDFPGMLNRLQPLDYRGFLALEYVWVDWKNCNRTDNVSETLLLRRALESNAPIMTTEG